MDKLACIVCILVGSLFATNASAQSELTWSRTWCASGHYTCPQYFTGTPAEIYADTKAGMEAHWAIDAFWCSGYHYTYFNTDGTRVWFSGCHYLLYNGNTVGPLSEWGYTVYASTCPDGGTFNPNWGGCDPPPRYCPVAPRGNPCDAANGNKVQTETDYSAPSGLRFARTYSNLTLGFTRFSGHHPRVST